LSRVLCGCAGDKNGEFSSELSVEVGAVKDGGGDNIDCGRNHPQEFQREVEASVMLQESGILKSSL
jgi:hypothetical protein